MTVPGLLVATDLDACLLDAETYSYEAARPALASLASRQAPLVLASSKTRAEMEPLGRVLGLGTPLIVENGGALLVPDGHLLHPPAGATLVDGFWTLVLGTRRPGLLLALRRLAHDTGARPVAFADLDADAVVSLTGLSRPAAELAMHREYDEPFTLDEHGDAAAMDETARTMGLRLTRGGRFWHLTGDTDKGRALRVLLGLYAAEERSFLTVGLGDSPNDLSLLQAVDQPIIVPGPGGHFDPALVAALPHAARAPRPGPSGWNDAVLAVLREHPPAGDGA